MSEMHAIILQYPKGLYVYLHSNVYPYGLLSCCGGRGEWSCSIGRGSYLLSLQCGETHRQIHDTNIAAATVIPFTILIGFLDIEEFEPKLSSIYLLDYIYLSMYLSSVQWPAKVV